MVHRALRNLLCVAGAAKWIFSHAQIRTWMYVGYMNIIMLWLEADATESCHWLLHIRTRRFPRNSLKMQTKTPQSTTQKRLANITVPQRCFTPLLIAAHLVLKSLNIIFDRLTTPPRIISHSLRSQLIVRQLPFSDHRPQHPFSRIGVEVRLVGKHFHGRA